MKFSVTTRTNDGKEETRVREAQSRFEIYNEVEKAGSTVVSMEEVAGGLALPAWMNIRFGSGVKTETRITFTKNLSAMLAAGLTLSRALSVIERQSPSKYFKTILSALQEKVKAGSGFHEALSEYPAVFSKLFVAMTKAGEESGKLAETLTVVAKQMETSNNLTKKVKGAMIYPSIILSAIAIIAILMLVYVVPTLASTFRSLNAELPFATRAIIASSDFVKGHILLVILGIAIVVALVYFAVNSKRGGKIGMMISLKLPIIGELVRETYSARASRTLSSLLSSGVEMLTAIGIAHEVVGDNVFGEVLGLAEEQVRKGDPLSQAFMANQKLYPIFVSEMVLVGEETGKVSDMLSQVAEYYERDVEERTKDLSTIIEPVLMLFIGAFVGVFALAMIAPIYSLSSKI